MSVGNFLMQNVFGRSNVGNNPAPQPQGQAYQQGNTQLQPQNNNNPAAVANNNAGNNEPNNNPNNNADPTKQAPGSQLDAFKDLFTIKTDDKGQPIGTPEDPFAKPVMSVDPQKLREAASKMSFTAGLDAELVQKAMSGQDPQAFMQVLNIVGQNGFSAALAGTANITNTALSEFQQRFEKVLPDRVRSVQISQSAPKNPALNHPAAAPVVNAMKMQIAQANPHLPPSQVAEMAENYFIAMAKDFSATEQTANASAGTKKSSEPDWSALLGT